ncbi:MAG: hypothetical protein J6J11_09150 [Treponema sp.]|nr:hypothetical protein [Clostridia bacterium]MBP3608465.1 hypothetical protein [Treponema sp.]
MTDQLFIVILNTEGEPDYSNPMEINAKSKNEAYNLVAQDVPAETIAGTFTVPEYQQVLMKLRGKTGMPQQQVQQTQPLIPQNTVDDMSGKDFLQNSINEAMNVAKGVQKTQEVSNVISEQQFQHAQASPIIQQNIVQNKVQYFMDDGIQFKIDNGILYKKVWETVQIEEYQNNEGQMVKPEFQIIIKETGKKLNSSKYAVQQLVWKPIKTQPLTNMIP